MRLTNYLRDRIAAQLAENALNERRQARAIAEHELALAIYAHVYKPTTRKAMDKLPAGWLPTAQHLWLRVSGGAVEDDLYFIALPAPRCVLAKHNDNKEPSLVLPRESQFAHRLRRLRSEAREIETKQNALRRQARLTLAPISTLRQLGERWPEAKPVAMGVIEQLRCTVAKPDDNAARKTELNTALGLTSVATAAKPAAARKAAPKRAVKKAA